VTVTLGSPSAPDDDGAIGIDGATATTLDDVDNVEIALGGAAADAMTADATAGSTLRGNAGNDTLTGGAGPDTFSGGPGADVMNGAGGTDLLTYSSVPEPVRVTLGDGLPNDGGIDDTSGANRDRALAIENATGGSGNDLLTGTAGANRLVGGSGNDTLRGLLGADTLVGGAGTDRASYAERTAAVRVSLDGTANDGAAGEKDLVGTDVEQAEGGSGDDMLTGGETPDALLGGAGDDRLTGGGGADALFAGAGDDTLEARDAVADAVDCGAGTDGGHGDPEDRLEGCENVEVVRPATNPGIPDADRDGIPTGVDCDDNDPRRFRGATEVPGNGVDEDCVNGDAELPVIGATISLYFETRGKRLRLTEWAVKNIPAGAHVRVTCTPPKGRRFRRACPFRTYDRDFPGGARNVSLLRRPLKNRLLVKGTVIRTQVTHPLAIGRVRIIRVRQEKSPRDTRSRLCLPPGAMEDVRCP
jgi:hypothetical protein